MYSLFPIYEKMYYFFPYMKKCTHLLLLLCNYSECTSYEVLYYFLYLKIDYYFFLYIWKKCLIQMYSLSPIFERKNYLCCQPVMMIMLHMYILLFYFSAAIVKQCYVSGFLIWRDLQKYPTLEEKLLVSQCSRGVKLSSSITILSRY